MRGVFLVTAMFAVGLGFCQAVYAAGGFDGRWKLKVDADKPCVTIPGQRFVIVIERDRLKIEESNATAGAHISGSVNRRGKLHAKVARGNRSAQGDGDLTENTGKGSWNSAHCKGKWTATRIKSE